MAVERDAIPSSDTERQVERSRPGAFRALGLGVVTGACDDDPVAIGTYASAGASFGASFLWTAPATFPMAGSEARDSLRSGFRAPRPARHSSARFGTTVAALDSPVNIHGDWCGL
jgi:hypothetical protein